MTDTMLSPNRLTPVRPAGEGRWLYRCVCGAEKEIGRRRVESGNTRSCGCLRREVTTARNYRHGDTPRARKMPVEYRAWVKLRGRCEDAKNPDYAYYGGRGIRVHPRWLGDGGYAAFLAEIGRRPSPYHSVDRIDNDRGYEPGNVRWATRSEQALNQRRSVWLEFRGERKRLHEWAAELGFKPQQLYGRLHDGWTVERALTTPVKEINRRG